MKVAHHFFENGIAFFTKIVNILISLVCANGDGTRPPALERCPLARALTSSSSGLCSLVAPFVGHNAFIRWSALQEIATEEADGRKQIWSECAHASPIGPVSALAQLTCLRPTGHVSEDFDCAIRILNAGYTIRWATYSNHEFQEGVSLSAEDEVNRWQKYAYGCSELLFNPIRYWPIRGPFSKQILRYFFKSDIPLHNKFSASGYMFSYYAIAVGLPLTLLNYILLGLFREDLDKAYMPSWDVILGVWVVFTAASPIALSILRFRTGTAGLLEAFLTQVRRRLLLLRYAALHRGTNDVFNLSSVHVAPVLPRLLWRPFVPHLAGAHIASGRLQYGAHPTADILQSGHNRQTKVTDCHLPSRLFCRPGPRPRRTSKTRPSSRSCLACCGASGRCSRSCSSSLPASASCRPARYLSSGRSPTLSSWPRSSASPSRTCSTSSS
jgi:hypothetical protein